MFHLKRLYSFILQSFVPVFAMTFGICLFIVLMQFLWKYVEDLVGKGLDNLVLAELFFYAGLSLIPLALPLSILLASLMTFGNMGERFELTAIKASGVSLLKAMRPLMILIAIISISAFFFQNEAMPRINVKFRTLLISIKQKSPELDIPEGSFYNGIDGYSIYVKKKNPDTGMLYGVMIYDTSKGFNDMFVFVCDSAKMRMSETKDFLRLSLYSGQRFSPEKDSNVSTTRPSGGGQKNTPYSRENFKVKDIIIRFDANFNRMEESAMDGSQISMNLSQLNYAIDSLKHTIDSLNREDRNFVRRLYLTPKIVDTTKVYEESSIQPTNLDSLLKALPRSELISIFERAKSKGDSGTSTFQFQSWTKTGMQAKIRQYQVESHRKFTLSFACLIFFFIGAPLGAIIRKGGLGMPVIISVILFIIYYIFDNVGVKMARDGVWEIWQGMWLSSFILFPLGVFLTYKSMNDSALFNTEAYGKLFRKLLRITPPQKTSEEDRSAIINSIPSVESLNIDPEFVEKLRKLDNEKLKEIVQNYKSFDYEKSTQMLALSILKENGANIDSIIDQQDKKLKETIFDLFCHSSTITLWAYAALVVLTIVTGLANMVEVSGVIDISYLILFFRPLEYYFAFYKLSTKKKSKIYRIIEPILLFILYPIMYYYIRRDMVKDIEKTKTVSFFE